MTTTCIEHITVAGDRWDLLAWDYYGDACGYARIVLSNPHVARTPELPTGIRVVIPVIEPQLSAAGLPPWKRGTR